MLTLLHTRFAKLRAIGLMLLVSLCLSGCVQYDVGIHFASQTRGEIVQHIRVGEKLTSFSDALVEEWLTSIKQRTRKLGGRIRQSKEELLVTIPFHNGADLAEKFNQFFQPAPRSEADRRSVKDDRPSSSDLPELRSTLKLGQNNWLLVERDRLTYDLDLRPLGVISAGGNLLVSPGSLLDLHFRLDTPWGTRHVSADPATTEQRGKQLVWTLKPGAINHLEVIFWVPSPLGIGTVAIVLLVLAGIYLKSRFSQPEVKATQSASLR